MEGIPSAEKLTKAEIMEILECEEYGRIPPPPISVRGEVIKRESFCAGKAWLETVTITCETENGPFSFPVLLTVPSAEGKHACFIHIAFRDNIPDRYMPSEELIDNGFAAFTMCYKDITNDTPDFSDGLAEVIFPSGRTSAEDCGKIMLWAWAAMRVMDYAETRADIDYGYISVCGHSRLGKTALLAGALDERFFCAFSNNSGTCGAALSRSKSPDSEHISDIVRSFSYWFCDNFKKYADNEEIMPFDQHFLLAANFPHRVYAASAAGDFWADPQNEFRACLAADKYFRFHGIEGITADKTEANPGDNFDGGYIGYHMRNGTHYFSREDWQKFMKYVCRHRNGEWRERK